MADIKDKISRSQVPLHDGSASQRLTRQHFALYRGYLDGVSEAQLHASYGDSGGDVRSTRRLIAALRDMLSVLARRAQDIEAAHLLRLRPGSIPSTPAELAASAPSLEAFRERVDPDGVFGEAELLALYREAHPADASPAVDRRTARNMRLRRRQADALARMEATLVHDPKPEHPVDGWFEPAVAARLAAAGIETISDLIALVERRGHRWHTAVPRLGPKGAQRIVDWLQLHADALGHRLSQLALVPRRQWAADAPARPAADGDTVAVAPLEAVRVPAPLDGSSGTNRASGGNCRLRTDIEAITAWLDARSASEHTRRAYRREAERLLLWALVEQNKPLSSLTSLDCCDYVHTFLVNPPPARWVAKERVERCLAGWRPFAGPLSDRSRETARAILNAMCQWLVEVGYLATNPFSGLERAATPPVFDAETRSLHFEQWKYVFDAVTRPQYTFTEHRDRLALLLAYATGLRRGELASATTDMLSVGRLAGVDAPVWRLSVSPASRGRRSRSVLLPPIVIEALQDNLAMRGLPGALDCPEGTPLLAQARSGGSITPDGIGKLFKAIFASAAAAAEKEAPGSGRRLALASTHWLRHTHSAHALAQGADIVQIGKGLGHASLTTTSLYLQDGGSRRLLGVERLLRETLALGSSSESA
ncbi:phage integrase family protein [Caballeronia sp. AZ10_KS36]|uniref:phage integrase family protein n=1 Tax=Caballeronia sp. AZ10_KS36 TaxID=2921757 RepID=UPI0020288328|nr:phage integrase family protein [Caballeronia sp. AZ10_KS36]